MHYGNECFFSNNSQMEVIFPDLITAIDSVSDVQCDISALSKILLSNFVIHQGCYLLEYSLPTGFNPIPNQEFIPDKSFFDRTSYEYFQNHLHTRELLTSTKTSLHHLLTGIIIADNLKDKLKVSFPSRKFRIIVSYPVLPLSAEEDEIKNDCTIRFHAMREGEYFISDLDEFKFDAIGVIDF